MSCDCNRETKRESEDENKTNSFLCVFSKFIWWKIKRQGNRKYILLQFYNLNIFLFFLSHPSSFGLVFFVYSLGADLKVQSSFWYYDLNTTLHPVYLHIRIRYINFWLLVIIYVIKYLRQRIKTNKNLPADSLSVFTFLIFDSTEYFAQ